MEPGGGQHADEAGALQDRDPARVVLEHDTEGLLQRGAQRDPGVHAAGQVADAGARAEHVDPDPAVQAAVRVQDDRPPGAVRAQPPGRPPGRLVQAGDRRLLQVAGLDRGHRQPLQAPVGADEPGDVGRRRGAQHRGGRVELLDPPLPVHRDPVTEADRLLDVVGDHQHRLAHRGLHPQELVLQLLPHHRVDRPERLVHQQHRRIGRQRPRHPDPLPLAARQLVRVARPVRPRIQAHQVEQLRRPGPRPRPLPADQRRHGRRVVEDRAVREEADLLDDVPDAPAQPYRVDRGDVLAAHQDPARGGLDQPVDHHHGRRLAAPRGPHQRDEFALRHLEGQPVHGGRTVRIPLADLLEPDHDLTLAAPYGPRSPAAARRG
ncbi:hypothetical protein GCM10020295_73030 [Streptomyces cinereospinus]